ncbi:protoporphyrinogen oxidase [Bacteroides helcogenes]|uniref:Coproporphyrinogen III oxidase n=1 Tax=Bacteroides helcogenes (strain ATCC 35417 / DSM 20613 / JCM 6297 / CCUG 15421 / P 36-108) TaxID=693979 RepID=E6SN61_BACT6|nr:protoporphyrinogen oxidase [Bacteroides helcogenes]ADV44714.1 protoporphyrinogen oxidase [Bacteroides helcogenes P 36-108]MDY5238525.1 protoporphyrinogen oxidase [Bacteroides helcogenes]
MAKATTIETRQCDVIVIGAGITGLTTAFYLTRRQKNVEVLERQNRIGGQIQTFHEDGFVFESGPNTGVISCPEVAELFSDLSGDCEPETAFEASKRRLIWKGECFHPLPSGITSAIFTPLFSLKDKLRILGEPFRPKGDDPDETIGMLAKRRLGKSFLDYAVDPFLSGVYAGDPMRLVTRFALPKLYHLEQRYGSFVKGAIAKIREHKNNRDKLATKQVFSPRNGFSRLIEALERQIGSRRITLGVEDITILPHHNHWKVRFTNSTGRMQEIHCTQVITTVGAYALPDLLPFIAQEQMHKICNLHYAPVIQVSVGLHHTGGIHHAAFGGLIPSCENKPLLGILFPSACFKNRAPEEGALFSCFIGGVRHPEYLMKSDDEIIALVTDALHSMLHYPLKSNPDMIRIFRHKKAIPQYDAGCGERLATIEYLQKQYPGLVLGGNIRDGIGIADRIRQAVALASDLQLV